jgi:glutamine cyclotransferase
VSPTYLRRLSGLLALGLLLLAACGGPEPTLTPTSTPTSTFTPTLPVTPSPTMIPTATSIPPSDTPLPSASSATPFPTNTPQPTAVALALNVTVGAEPQDIAVANGFLWVAQPDGIIQAFTPEGASLVAIHVDGGAIGLATDGSRLWVAHRSGVVTQIDTATGAITARWTITCAECLVRGIHWDGSSLWVSNFAEATLHRIEVNSGAITALPAGADSPTMMTSDAAGLLVLHQSLAAQSVVLTRHNSATGEVTGSITATGFPTAMLSNGIDLWLSLREADVSILVRYDAQTLAETWRIEANPANELLLAKNSLWSADFTSDTVTQRDPATGAVLDVYPVGDLPQALAYDNGLLWVVNRRAGTLTRLWIGF